MHKLNKCIKFIFGIKNNFEEEDETYQTPLEKYISQEYKINNLHIDLETIRISENELIISVYDLENEIDSIIKLDLKKLCKNKNLKRYFFKKIIFFLQGNKILNFINNEEIEIFYSSVHFIELVEDKIIFYYSCSDTLEFEKEIKIFDFLNFKEYNE